MNKDELVAPVTKPGFSSKVVYIVAVLTIIAAAALVIFAIIGFTNDTRQTETTQQQTEETKKLVEQVKSLTEQNQRTSQQAANYAYCNAVLLSQYTQTVQPITIEDLNRCVLNSFPNSTVTGPDGQVQTNTNNSSANNPAPQSSSNNTTNNNTTVNPPAATPSTPATPAAPNTPAEQQPGLNLTLPCVNALGLIQLGCR